MSRLITFLISLLIALWCGAIAILAVQNYAPISLQLLQWNSITLPFGVTLAFFMGLGLLFGPLVSWLIQPTELKKKD
jgi:uncharacterized integral membrane protein